MFKTAAIFSLNKRRSLYIVGGVFLVFGLIGLFIALFFGFYIEQKVKDGITDKLVIDSPDQDGYDDWLRNTQSDAVPIYENYRVWNLTNIDEVKHGAKPNYTLGPNCYYRKYYEKLNVSFIDDGTQVSYNKRTWYVLENSMSDPLCNSSAKVYNINPFYVGVIQKVGGENNLAVALVGPTLSKVFADLLTTAVPQFSLFVATGTALAGVKTALINSFPTNVTDRESYFCSIWTSTKEAPAEGTALWTAFGWASTATSESNIPVTSCLLLFNSSFPYSLLNPQSFRLWAGAFKTDPEALKTVESIYKMNLQQLILLALWQQGFVLRNKVEQGLLSTFKPFGVQTLPDLGWLQWTAAPLFKEASVNDVLKLNLPGVPEFFVWQKNIQNVTTPVTLPFSDVKTLMNSTTTGLFHPESLAHFLQYVAMKKFSEIQATWNLDPTTATLLAGYFIYISKTFVDQTLLNLPGSGLFVGRTVEEWLWNGVDPLLQLLGQPSSASLQSRDSVTPLPSTFYTGKDSIDKLALYVEYLNSTKLCGFKNCPHDGVWEDDLPISGTEGTQFEPFLDKSDQLILWSTDVLRPVVLDFVMDDSIKGLDVWKYSLSSTLFNTSPFFFQSIYGFANMSSNYNGLPVFFCKPNFYGVDSVWLNQLNGMNPNKETDETYLSVEPTTGTVMNAEKKLQLNIYFDNVTASLFPRYYPSVKSGLFYPVFIGTEGAVITDELAQKFKDKVYYNLKVKGYIYYTFIFTGGFFTILGLTILLFVLICVYLNKKYWNYETVF